MSDARGQWARELLKALNSVEPTRYITVGMTGQGKSILTRKWLEAHKNKKIIVLDPKEKKQ